MNICKFATEVPKKLTKQLQIKLKINYDNIKRTSEHTSLKCVFRMYQS